MFVGLTSGMLCLSCMVSYKRICPCWVVPCDVEKSTSYAQIVTTFSLVKASLDIYLRDGDDAGAGGIPNSPG